MNHTSFDVTAIGELLIDFTPGGTNDRGINLFEQNPGGAPANVLAMNARLGGKTAFIGKVGQDAFGHFLKRTLADITIDVSGLIMDKNYSTTLAFVHLNTNGDRSFSFYRQQGADMMLTSEEVNQEIISAGKIFHFGAVSLTDEPCRSAIHFAVRLAREQGKIVSYDPNYRPLLWRSKMQAKYEILRLLPMVDILKVSEEEMTLLTGETKLEKGATKLAEQGPTIVLVSLGAKGAFYFCGDGYSISPAYDVKTVDTTGAGDAFLGATHYRIRGKNLVQLHGISKDELSDIVEFANAAGSLATMRKGAIPAMPDLAEIDVCRKNVPRIMY